MKHVLSIKPYMDINLLNELFAAADKFKHMKPADHPPVLKNKVVATLFYEPSTRTRLSFESAAVRLGAGLISTENAGQFSSAAKGENIEDTIRTINGYADAIVLRHPEEGSAERAASVSGVPIINGGDGPGEHPTQALLDIYTLQEAKGKIDGLKIAFVGDQLHNRTQRSFIMLLSMFNIELYLISPPELQLATETQEFLKKQGVKFHLIREWDKVLSKLDMLYINRIEKERFGTLQEYEAVKNAYCITKKTTNQMKKDAIIMAPLPRLHEISPEVDKDPRAIYFEQARNGLYVRMALLESLLA